MAGENGLINRTTSAKQKTEVAGIQEELQTAIEALKIDYHTAGSNETIGAYISNHEEDLQKAVGDATLIVNNDKITYKGLKFTVNAKTGKITNSDGNNQFDSVEWDKTAATDDCFYWGSDVEGEEGYNTIIGYKSKVENYTLLRYPSRCKYITISNSDFADGTTAIETRSFTKNILKIEIPNTVKTIEGSSNGNFSMFKSLAEIKFCEGIEEINSEAFYSCPLTSLNFPSSLKTIGYGAFANCRLLKSVNLPDGLISIEGSAFSSCTSLENINLPVNLSSIGWGAFRGCSMLDNIVLPEALNSLRK